MMGKIDGMEKFDVCWRFLLVEDEMMIAMLLEDYLDELGQRVAGHADSVDAALALLASDPDIDFAFLDVNLRGETVAPVAADLSARGISFCFMTGAGKSELAPYPDAPLLAKPFDFASVRTAISEALSHPPRRMIDVG
jgi:CheY-like chemotaxis protein